MKPETALTSTATLPRALAANPRLSCWVGVGPDGLVSVRVGKVELGQGIVTALAQIAADELDVELTQIRMVAANTADGPDEGLTSGSMSVTDSGSALRQACAEVRALFVDEAVAVLGLDPRTVTVRGGIISDAAGRSTSYGQLATQVSVDVPASGAVRPKRTGQLRVVGTSVARLDLPDKIAGRSRFIQDLTLPGQLFGRVVRPPSPAATLSDLQSSTVEKQAGVVAVVRDGSFLGVVAETEYGADRAAEALAGLAKWHEEQTLPDEDDLDRVLRTSPVETVVIDESDGGPARAQPLSTARASYSRPFIAHASMAPSCGVARWDDGSVTVWSHSQGVRPLRRAIAAALRIDPGRVTVRHVEGAGCYGHNGADDAAFDAVLLARSVPGRPVRVLWSRRDELSWAPFGSAMVIDIEAATDAAGDVVTWSADVWSQGHTSRPGYAGSPGLLAAAHQAQRHALPPPVDPPAANGGGTARNAVPGYTLGHRRIRTHRVLTPSLRSSALRSLGAFANVFAIESFMDELAAAAGRDPLEYRLAHIDDPRAREVLTAAARLGGWERRGSEENVGLGLGYARYKNRGAYCAVLAEVEMVHDIRVRRLAVAVDVGAVVNPDGVRNQIAGGAVQATSWTLTERVRFDRWRVTSTDWESYPILRFSEVPAVEVDVLSRPDEPSLGSGEAAQGPTAAAIANAVAAAVGARVRDLPITVERVVAALDAL